VPSILVVDDNPAVLETVTAILQTRYEVLTATDGVNALEILDSRTPDLLLTNLTMPRMSGAELIAVVRARLPQLPIIAFSGMYADMPDSIAADAFLLKGGYSVRELFAQVDALLPHRKADAQPAASVATPIMANGS
jgi:CheY-like chemotaxis protein